MLIRNPPRGANIGAAINRDATGPHGNGGAGCAAKAPAATRTARSNGLREAPTGAPTGRSSIWARGVRIRFSTR